MDIKIFDNRILAPSKCGSRHLSKCFDSKRWDFDNYDSLTHMIIRNPLEHFKSAIHTEYYNSDTDLQILIQNCITDKGIGHWNPYTYQFLYKVLLSNPKIEVIELSNLSSFLISENYSLDYNQTEYDWSDIEDWMNKNEFYQKITESYPYEINLIKTKIDLEFYFYDKLIDKNISKTLI